MPGIDFRTGTRTSNPLKRLGGTPVTPAKEPRFEAVQPQGHLAGYGADRSATIRKGDDLDVRRAIRPQVTGQPEATPLIASIAPGLSSLAATKLPESSASPSPATSSITSKPGFTDSFYDSSSTANTASQVRDAQDQDFWRNQGVMQNRSNEQRGQGVNDRADSENFKLQSANIDFNYGVSNRNAETNNASRLQNEASAQAMARQQNANASESARNSETQAAETERQRIASNAQLQLGALQSFSSSAGGGSFRYW